MSKSGSRYGRRSNWFKIHCLLQEQQQQYQQQTQQETQQNNNLQSQQHDIVTTTTTIGGHTDDIAGFSLRVTAGAGADADGATCSGLFVPECQRLGFITVHNNSTDIFNKTTTTTTTTNTNISDGARSIINKCKKNNDKNVDDLLNIQQIETQLRVDKELITPTESNMSIKINKQQQQQNKHQHITNIETNILTSMPAQQQSENLLNAAAKFLNSVMVGANNNSNNSQQTYTESSDSGASLVDDADNDFKSYFNWNDEDSLHKTDIEIERKHERRRRRLLRKFLRPHSEPLRSPVPAIDGLSPQRNVSKIATITPLLNIGLFPIYSNTLTTNDIHKADMKESHILDNSEKISLQQEEPIDLSLKSNCIDNNAKQMRIRRTCNKKKLSVPLDLRIERSSATKLSR